MSEIIIGETTWKIDNDRIYVYCEQCGQHQEFQVGCEHLTEYIEKVKNASKVLNPGNCRCTGLVHRNDCPEWVLPY